MVPNSKLLTITTMVLLLQVKFILNHEVCLVDTCSCKYWFVEQPNNTFLCDPYVADIFATRCVVEYTVESGDALEVNWYYRDSPDGIPQEVPSGSAMILSSSNCGLTRSDLTLSQLEDLNVGDQGHRYFCRINLNGKMINDSQEVRLHSKDIIGNVRPPCGMNESIQSELKRRCIDPPTPPEPTTTQPIPTSIHLSVSTATISTLLPSATPESPDPESPDDPKVDDGNGDGNTNESGSSLSSGEEILIYIAIGVAVFLFVVVFMLVVCACIWNSAFRQSKYCTCS